TTQRPELLSEAELARFKDIIPLLYPGERGRFDILKRKAKDLGEIANDDVIRQVAKATSFWTGEELQQLVRAVWGSKDSRDSVERRVAGAMELIGRGVNRERRDARFQELKDFSIRHCTDSRMRDGLLGKAESDFVTTTPCSDPTPNEQPDGKVHRAL